MTERSGWMTIVDEDPDHSERYVQRFRNLAADGFDLAGEARLVDALAPRGARILDAGCGPGRVGAILAGGGHLVVGVDVDPVLIAAAEQDHPGPTWIVADLADLDLGAVGLPDPFDVIVCAGNVMAFLAPSTRVPVLERLHAHLNRHGRLVVGFGSGRGYEFSDFFADAEAAGFGVDVALSTWDLRPLRPESDFLVAVLSSLLP